MGTAKIDALRRRITVLERGDKMLRFDYSRADAALESLMRAVAVELSRFTSPASIAGAALIDALAEASRLLHRPPTEEEKWD